MPWPFPSSASAPAGLNAPRLVRVTEPGAEPITADEAKLWLKVDDSTDDALITGLITAARSLFEELTGRTLIDTTYRAEWDHLPRVGSYIGAGTARILELPRAPLKSSTPVAWVKYSANDADGTETTFDSDNYTVDTGRDPGRFARLWLDEDADWPELGSFPGALRCEFTAGYGAAATAVPEEIKATLKMMIAAIYQDRTNENPEKWMNHPLITMHVIRPIA